MKPVLDPKRDLVGATPETLARALLRPSGGPRPRRKSVRSDEVPVVADRPNGATHVRVNGATHGC